MLLVKLIVTIVMLSIMFGLILTFSMLGLTSFGLFIRYKTLIMAFIEKLRYKPKRVYSLYDFEFMHGGAYINCEANSRESYLFAVKMGSGIKIDLQFSKDYVPFCFPDRYMSKLTGIPGKFNHKTSRELQKYYMERFEILPLNDALEIVSSQSPLILSISGNISKGNLKSLNNLLSKYSGIYYIEVSNIFSYLKLRTLPLYFNNVIFKYNVFRKKINMIANGMCDIKNPNVSPLEVIIAIEESLEIEKISDRLFNVFSKCSSRITPESSILTRPIVHRGIIDSTKYGEHEIPSMCETVRRGCVYEGDVTDYNGNIVWYHSDKFSGKVIKQPASAAEKIAIENAPTLEEGLKAIADMKDLKLHPAIIIDIKDAHTFNRNLEKKLLNICEKYNKKIEIYFSYYNPVIGVWLFKNYSEYRRIGVYNSLEGIKWLANPIRIAISAVLSSNNKSDAGNWNIGPKGNAIVFSKFVQKSSANVNLVYAPKNEEELAMFKPYFANWVVEDVANQQLWKNTFDYHDDGIITLKKIPV